MVDVGILATTPAARATLRARPQQSWLWCVVVATAAAFAVSILAAPAAAAPPTRGLSWLLFLGSSVHVASTGVLFSFAAVRSNAGQHRGRYMLAPVALVVAAAAIASLAPPRLLAGLLLGYFGWQFFHYQKQNLGLAALAASSYRIASMSCSERRAIMAAGGFGIAALALHPGILQLPLNPHHGWYPALPFHVAAIGFVASVLGGLTTLARRPAADRPSGYCAVYLLAICFPLPIFVFASPYAAVGGMTIAHGLQYLVLIAMVTAGPASGRASLSRLTSVIVAALVVGAGLSLASHLHSGGPFARVVYGAYLGVVMTHFVVDAGIWRLRDAFPRRFLAARMPYLLNPAPVSAPDASPDGVG